MYKAGLGELEPASTARFTALLATNCWTMQQPRKPAVTKKFQRFSFSSFSGHIFTLAPNSIFLLMIAFLHVTSPSNPVFARQELGKSWREKCDVDQTMGGARKWHLLLEGTLKAAFVRDSRCRCRGERPRFLLLFPADGNFHAFSSQYK